MYWGYKKNPFLDIRISHHNKALLVQFGRTWVSKTRCRRFKSYRARFRSCFVRSKLHGNNGTDSQFDLFGVKVKKEYGQSKKSTLINQRSSWSPRLYCKYAVTTNPAKVIGIRPKTIPNRKTSIIFIFSLKREKER